MLYSYMSPEGIFSSLNHVLILMPSRVDLSTDTGCTNEQMGPIPCLLVTFVIAASEMSVCRLVLGPHAASGAQTKHPALAAPRHQALIFPFRCDTEVSTVT